MIDSANTSLLFVEPETATAAPLVDSLTRRVTAAYRAGRVSEYNYKGTYITTWGTGSDIFDHWVVLANGAELLTHSLLIHYVAHCRSEIPAVELRKLEALPAVEAEPTSEELWPVADPALGGFQP